MSAEMAAPAAGQVVWVRDPDGAWFAGEVVGTDRDGELWTVEAPPVDGRVRSLTVRKDSLSPRYETVHGTAQRLEQHSKAMRDAVSRGDLQEAVRLAHRADRLAADLDAKIDGARA